MQKLIKKIFLAYILCHPGLYSQNQPLDSKWQEEQKSNIESTPVYFFTQLFRLNHAIQSQVIYYVDVQNTSLTKKSILFTYKAMHARKVSLVSNAYQYAKVHMTRNPQGIWFYIMPFDNRVKDTGGKIEYQYLVDNVLDSGEQGEAHLLMIDICCSFKKQGLTIVDLHNEYSNTVSFKLYAPNAKQVSLIGNFNSWDARLDIMKKTKNGYFEYTKHFVKGDYVYLYRIDNKLNQDHHHNSKKHHPIYGVVSHFIIQ